MVWICWILVKGAFIIFFIKFHIEPRNHLTCLWTIILLLSLGIFLTSLSRFLSYTPIIQLHDKLIFIILLSWRAHLLFLLNTWHTWASLMLPNFLPIRVNLVWIWWLESQFWLLHPYMVQVLHVMIHCLLAEVWVWDKGFAYWLRQSFIDDDFVEVVSHCVLIGSLVLRYVCLITAHFFINSMFLLMNS